MSDNIIMKQHGDVDNIDGKIFVGGLSWQTTEEGLKYYFEKFGELTDVAIMSDKRTGQPRGFGFICLKDPAAVDIVLGQTHNIDGRVVDVKRAVPRDKAPAPSRQESRKIFVGGLAPEVGEKEFSDYFSKYGTLQDSIVMYDRKTNRSRGFGFVTFENEEAIQAVLRIDHEIMGKWVEIKRAEPREQSKSMGGMGGRMDMRGGDPRMRGRYDDYGYGGGGYPMQGMHNAPHMGGRGPAGGPGAGYGYPGVRYGDAGGDYGGGGGGMGRGGGYGGGGYGYPGAGMGGYFGGGGGGGYPGYGGAGPSGGGMYPGLASRGGNQGAPLDDVDNPYGNPNAARAPSADQYVGGGGAVARTSQPMGASGAVGGYGNPSNRGGGVSMYGYAQPQAMGYGGSYAVGQSSGGMSMYQQQGGGLPGMSATGSSPVAGTGKPNEGVASYAEAGGVSVAGYGASASAGYSNRSVPGSSQQQGRMDRSYRPY